MEKLLLSHHSRIAIVSVVKAMMLSDNIMGLLPTVKSVILTRKVRWLKWL